MPSFLLTVNLDKEGEFTMSTRKAKLAFHGRDRKRIKKCMDHLIQIQKMDVRNAARATTLGVPAVNFQHTTGVNVTGGVQAVIDRCIAALAQRVSMQPNAAPDRV